MIKRMYKSSRGWYTYRTSAVSTEVCCVLVGMSFGNDARRDSILALLMSRNWREITAVV